MNLPSKFRLKVKTNKSVTKFFYDDGYVMEVTSKPIKGLANKEIIDYFKKNFNKNIQIKGLTSNNKIITVIS